MDRLLLVTTERDLNLHPRHLKAMKQFWKHFCELGREEPTIYELTHAPDTWTDTLIYWLEEVAGGAGFFFLMYFGMPFWLAFLFYLIFLGSTLRNRPDKSDEPTGKGGRLIRFSVLVSR